MYNEIGSIVKEYTPIALKASDKQDIDIVSAVLQDAILPPLDITYDKGQQVFTLVCSRFIREISGAKPHRVTMAFYATCITGVQKKNITRADDMVPLVILSVTLCDGYVVIQCSDDKAIRLEVGVDFSVLIKDLDNPYPTTVEPCHDKED